MSRRKHTLDVSRHWFHLHNPFDAVLANLPIDIQHAHFTQVETDFLYDPPLNHDATAYLSHKQAQANMWARLSVSAPGAKSPKGHKAAPARPASLSLAPAQPTPRLARHKQRALLVGINQYAQAPLSGCVNDVFSMSAMLQEQGWHPDSIRVVLDERATTDGVLQRLHWLLDDVRDDPDEVRLFYFSGHGAQLTQYDAKGEPDHRAETLVTHDMNWRENVGITDKDLAQLYAHLPFASRLYFIFDCCHSGGLTRGAHAAKGIVPPDDVQHRSLKWDPQSNLWVSRQIDLTGMLASQDRNAKNIAKFFGKDQSTHKFGRAISRWYADGDHAQQLAKQHKHFVPFNPVVISSCRENQFAYEYHHGAESHGAFTYVLTQLMLKDQRELPLEGLVDDAGVLLKKRLGLVQKPNLYNPGNKLGLFETAKVKKQASASRKKAK